MMTRRLVVLLAEIGDRMIKSDCSINTINVDSTVQFHPNNVHISVKGKNNLVKVGKGCRFINSNIQLIGNNITLIIEDNVVFFGTKIRIFQDCEVFIGKGTTINTGELTAAEGKNVHIGRDCMIANGFEIRNSDMHPIYDRQTGRRLNDGESIFIDDHVWLAKDVVVLKGVRIEKNIVVGIRSVVSKNLSSSHSIAAGTPAVIVRDNVIWGRMMYNKTMYDDTTLECYITD